MSSEVTKRRKKIKACCYVSEERKVSGKSDQSSLWDAVEMSREMWRETSLGLATGACKRLGESSLYGVLGKESALQGMHRERQARGQETKACRCPSKRTAETQGSG